LIVGVVHLLAACVEDDAIVACAILAGTRQCAFEMFSHPLHMFGKQTSGIHDVSWITVMSGRKRP
jgi:hypothetical protein